MFGLPQLEGEKKKKVKQHNQRMYTLMMLDREFHSRDMQENSEVFLNHGNLVGKSESKNKIQYPNILSGWTSTIPIK